MMYNAPIVKQDYGGAMLPSIDQRFCGFAAFIMCFDF